MSGEETKDWKNEGEAEVERLMKSGEREAARELKKAVSE